MSKTGWIILAVCLCLVFCVCAGLFIAGKLANSVWFNRNDSRVDANATQGYKDLSNPYAADGIYSVKMDGLDELTIDWISGSVIVELTDGDVVRFQETADKAIKEQDALRYGINGGKLRIQACKKNHTGKLPDKTLIVYLPRPLADGMKECEIDTVSAAVTAGQLNLRELEIDTVSGKVALQDMAANEADFDTVSGDIILRGCSFDSLRMDSVSGLLSFSGVIQKVKASSLSGSVQLFLDAGEEVRVSTMSGFVSLDLAATPKSLQVDTTSGNTDITLRKDASCTVTLDTMSGKLYLNEEAISAKQVTLGEGSTEFDIDSMSGSVHIHTK